VCPITVVVRTFTSRSLGLFQKLHPDCGSEVVLRPGDVVICRECGYRILYKKRTKQGVLFHVILTLRLTKFVAVVQFEAR